MSLFGQGLSGRGALPDGVAVPWSLYMTAMEVPVALGDAMVQPQASFGVALAGPGEADPDELMRRADLAMYRAKQVGVTGFAVHEPAAVA